MSDTICPVCRQNMKVINDKLQCLFCEGFYCFDMAKEWIEHIAKKSYASTPNKTEPNKDSRKKRTP